MRGAPRTKLSAQGGASNLIIVTISRVQRISSKVGWLLVALGVLVGTACATRQLTGGRLWGFRAPPTIKGTNITVPRAWRAEEPTRDWNWIVIHHSASDAGGAVIFDQWHRKRGWDELGYHFVINNGDGRPDGEVEVGSRWFKQKQGAHAKSASGQYNQRGIGICLVGNFEKNQPTPAQRAALLKLTNYLAREFAIPSARIIGHRDVNSTTLCPGVNMNLALLRHEVDWF